MPADTLGVKQRAALLALMAVAREVSNPELEQLTGFRIYGKALRKLRDRRLVESRQLARNRPLLLTLTDDGWAWCEKELAAERPDRAGSAAGALYAVLGGLHRYLVRTNLHPSDVFRPDDGQPLDTSPPLAEPALTEQIRSAYRTLASEPRDLVRLTDLRPLLGDAPREAVDAALRQLSRARQANLFPQANQKVLSQADRQAAVRIGNEDCHLISLERA